LGVGHNGISQCGKTTITEMMFVQSKAAAPAAAAAAGAILGVGHDGISLFVKTTITERSQLIYIDERNKKR
jgi:hypothetical protein